MSWLKQSDAAANHPLVLRILELEDFDDRLLNEVYGWINRCATQSAAHDMDYIVEIGTARMLAGSRYEPLKAAAMHCGIFFEKEIQEEIKDDEGNVLGTRPRRVLKLVEEKDLFHMILKSEKDWEQQRQYDNRNPERSGPVRMRDGDECRWCGRITRWDADRRSARMGTIDHLVPGEKDGPVKNRVIACKQCNSQRQEGENWDKPLRPVPTNPYYSAETAKWLFEKCGYKVTPTEQRKETTTPTPLPAVDEQKAVEPPTRVEDPAKEGATAHSGANQASSPATEQPGPVESPGATATPAQGVRSHSDLTAFPNVESLDEPEAVEPPTRVEDPAPRRATAPSGAPAKGKSGAKPANDQSPGDPEPGQATAHTGHPGARSNPGTDQTPTKRRSTENQLKTRDDSYGRSGFAGSGRDGTGRAGSGRAGSRDLEPEDASGVPRSPVPARKRRRNRPRKR